jgi:hypothetical protein
MLYPTLPHTVQKVTGFGLLAICRRFYVFAVSDSSTSAISGCLILRGILGGIRRRRELLGGDHVFANPITTAILISAPNNCDPSATHGGITEMRSLAAIKRFR